MINFIKNLFKPKISITVSTTEIKPIRYQDAAFVVAYNKDGLLCAVTNRRKKVLKGRPLIGLPGGKVDPGETYEQTARRECLEEGWKLGDSHLQLLITQYVDSYKCVWFLYEGTDVTMLHDHKEAPEIFPVLVDDRFVTQQGNAAAIEMAKKIRNNISDKKMLLS